MFTNVTDPRAEAACRSRRAPRRARAIALVRERRRGGARRPPARTAPARVGRSVPGDVAPRDARARCSPPGRAARRRRRPCARARRRRREAAVGPAAEDQAAADARAEREHDQSSRRRGRRRRATRRARPTFASLSTPTGRPSALRAIRSRSVEPASGDVHGADDAMPSRWSIRDGTPKPTAATRLVAQRLARPPRGPRRNASCDSSGVGRSRCRSDACRPRSTSPARIFVPPTSTPITRVRSTAAATLTRRMAPRREAVPRLPRRARKGKVPTVPRPERERRRAGRRRTHAAAALRGHRRRRRGGAAGRASAGSGSILRRAPRAARRLGRRELPLVRERRQGREQAAARSATRARSPSRTAPALEPDDDPPPRHRPRRRRAARGGDQHSDSIMLVRTDPDRHRALVPLDPARPARRRSPATATKINAAYQIGGAAARDPDDPRASRALPDQPRRRSSTSPRFKKLIDAVGGVDVDVPRPILSNRFDCPLEDDAQCARWTGWRFEKGAQHMNGRRALIYSRVRENRLNPADTDITRGERQQQVVAGDRRDKLTSVGTFVRLPFDRRRPARSRSRPTCRPGEFLQLGWVQVPRRLGARSTAGSAATRRRAAATVIRRREDNRRVIAMFAGDVGAAAAAAGHGCSAPAAVIGEPLLG